jgi:SNF2 family DNA or RNA helicase
MLSDNFRQGMAVKTFGRLYLDNKGWHIDGAEPHVCIKLKSIFTSIPKHYRNFIFSDTPENCHDLAWFIERYPLAISPDDLNKLHSQRQNHIDKLNELEQILLPDYKPHKIMLKGGYEGREYQTKGMEVFIKSKRLLIGDDIGLGKTMIGILALLQEVTLPAIVVVQAHLPRQWRDEIVKFSNLRFHMVKGTPTIRSSGS